MNLKIRFENLKSYISFLQYNPSALSNHLSKTPRYVYIIFLFSRDVLYFHSTGWSVIYMYKRYIIVVWTFASKADVCFIWMKAL